MPETQDNKEQYISDLEKMSPEAIVEKYGAAKLIEMLKAGAAAETRLEQAEKDLTAAQSEAEEYKDKYFQERFDERTKLERDSAYHKRLNHAIDKLMADDPALEEMTNGEAADQAEIERLREVPLTVAAADLAYLSKYNEDPQIQMATGKSGHSAGDTILRETAALLQEVDVTKREIKPKLDLNTRSYRTGGDEFSLILEHPLEKADDIAHEFKIKQANIEIPGADLPPSINIETAHVSEAFELFMKAVPQAERQEMTRFEKAKKIQDFLSDIADRRASIQKGRERIKGMTKLLGDDEAKFDRNFSWLTKGAFRLKKDVFVDLLAQQRANPEGFDKVVNELVKEHLAKQREEAVERQAREYEALIEIADKKFV